ncbi:MAG: 50S ribosomal protein L1 [Candidatus Woesearchaeota archaeon]
MEKAQALKAIQQAKTESKQRKFKQTIDLIINLKGLDLKKTESQIDSFVQLHYPTGKKVKVCALIGAELKAAAEATVDKTIMSDDFEEYASNKKQAKKLSNGYQYFIGQANIMPKIAATFGRVLGPRGKMPNPKAGCIVPPNANLKPLYEKLQKTIRLQARTCPVIQAAVGQEGMPEDEVVDNILTIYNSIVNLLPNGEYNIKSVFVKLTMGKPAKI